MVLFCNILVHICENQLESCQGHFMHVNTLFTLYFWAHDFFDSTSFFSAILQFRCPQTVGVRKSHCTLLSANSSRTINQTIMNSGKIDMARK